MELLPKLTSLTYLDLRDNPINSETKVHLAAVVAKCPGLRADWTADVTTTVLLQSPKDKVDPHNRYYRVVCATSIHTHLPEQVRLIVVWSLQEGEAEEVVRPINLSFQVHKTQPRYLCDPVQSHPHMIRCIPVHCISIADHTRMRCSDLLFPLFPLCVWCLGVKTREPTTKSEWLKERNKVIPTKTLTKKDDPEHVGTIVKDHESAEIAISLDFGEDWSTFWPKLEKLVRSPHR
jgi:hypothetical protein